MHTLSSRRDGVVVAWSICIGALVSPASAAGSLAAETEALEWMTGGTQYTDSDLDTTTPGPAQAFASAQFPSGNSLTSSNAAADFGFVEVVTEAYGVYSAGVGQTVNAQSLSRASFSDDTVRVTAPGFGPGQFGSFTARFELNHDVELDPLIFTENGGRIDIFGGYDLTVHIGDASPGPFNGQWFESTSLPDSAPSVPTGVIEVPVNFEYGVPFTISADLEINLFVSVTDGVTGLVQAKMDLGSAFFWQGVDITGLPAGLKIQSVNVNDWTKAYPDNVPAPGAAVLLACGAAPLCRRRRR